MDTKKILCVGIVTVDVITRPVAALPPAGVAAHVSSVSMHVGGCAANAAADLSKIRCNIHSIRMINSLSAS